MKRDSVNQDSNFTLKTQSSIVSLRISWYKEGIFKIKTTQEEENPFMEVHLKMKISKQNMIKEVFFPWQIMDNTRITANSLLSLKKQNGLIINMLFSDRLLKIYNILISLKNNNLKVKNHFKILKLLIQVNCCLANFDNTLCYLDKYLCFV